MYSKWLLTAFVASSVIADPGQVWGPDNCPDSDPENQCYVTNVGYYSDAQCTNQINFSCLYGGDQADQCAQDHQAGQFICNDPNLPIPGDSGLYAKVKQTNWPGLQIVYTQDQSCPPGVGTAGTYATLIDNEACVQLSEGGDRPGVSLFPAGGAGISKMTRGLSATGNRTISSSKFRARDAVTKVVRDTPTKRQSPPTQCTGMTWTSQTDSETASQQISSIVNCVNGNDSGCQIQIGDQMTTTIETMYSATAGVDIAGIMASTTFGMSFSDSETTTQQQTFTVPQGQQGYLSVYCGATLFRGTFHGCQGDTPDIDGSALVLRENALTYSVVLTGA